MNGECEVNVRWSLILDLEKTDLFILWGLVSFENSSLIFTVGNLSEDIVLFLTGVVNVEVIFFCRKATIQYGR